MATHRVDEPAAEETSQGAVMLECSHVAKSYGRVRALNDISFQLRKKEILGIAGDNGAGKSTLIKIIRGAVKPSSGKIYLEGREVIFESPREATEAGVACVYQESTSVEQLTMAENFFLGQEPVRPVWGGLFRFVDYRKMWEESRVSLKELGFDLDVRELISNFSGGQRQAVAITRAMHFKPKLILLDEPTSALSEKAIDVFFEILRRSKHNYPMIFVTHDLDDTLRLCDRIIVIKHGEVTFETKVGQGIDRDELITYM
ncbi:MAG TPA: ATP-binding cassette domain-containing protein [Atribacteraceae bacterium]|nr:ATP-binding cassette domain-containing protein [Atribacteraceae bacterium]